MRQKFDRIEKYSVSQDPSVQVFNNNKGMKLGQITPVKDISAYKYSRKFAIVWSKIYGAFALQLPVHQFDSYIKLRNVLSIVNEFINIPSGYHLEVEVSPLLDISDPHEGEYTGDKNYDNFIAESRYESFTKLQWFLYYKESTNSNIFSFPLKFQDRVEKLNNMIDSEGYPYWYVMSLSYNYPSDWINRMKLILPELISPSGTLKDLFRSEIEKTTIEEDFNFRIVSGLYDEAGNGIFKEVNEDYPSMRVLFLKNRDQLRTVLDIEKTTESTDPLFYKDLIGYFDIETDSEFIYLNPHITDKVLDQISIQIQLSMYWLYINGVDLLPENFPFKNWDVEILSNIYGRYEKICNDGTIRKLLLCRIRSNHSITDLKSPKDVKYSLMQKLRDSEGGPIEIFEGALNDFESSVNKEMSNFKFNKNLPKFKTLDEIDDKNIDDKNNVQVDSKGNQIDSQESLSYYNRPNLESEIANSDRIPYLKKLFHDYSKDLDMFKTRFYAPSANIEYDDLDYNTYYNNVNELYNYGDYSVYKVIVNSIYEK